MSNGKKQQIILQADTPEKLTAKLAGVDINIPPLSKPKTEHAERYCIAHLLESLPLARLFFPLTLIHQDKPDFLLLMADNQIGIEHTEAVPENKARKKNIEQKESLRKNDIRCYSALVCTDPDEPKKSNRQLNDEIQYDDAFWEAYSLDHDIERGVQAMYAYAEKCNHSNERVKQAIDTVTNNLPFFADANDNELASAMAKALAHPVEKKLLKVKNKDFTLYKHNWLIIYDNWGVLYDREDMEMPLSLNQHLKNSNTFSVFDTVFVKNDSKIYEFHKGHFPVIHENIHPNSQSLFTEDLFYKPSVI